MLSDKRAMAAVEELKMETHLRCIAVEEDVSTALRRTMKLVDAQADASLIGLKGAVKIKEAFERVDAFQNLHGDRLEEIGESLIELSDRICHVCEQATINGAQCDDLREDVDAAGKVKLTYDEDADKWYTHAQDEVIQAILEYFNLEVKVQAGKPAVEPRTILKKVPVARKKATPKKK